ncbi:MAG: interleukin-like EMT inducer domain-containing protein [Bryobacteraceae bacterium]
MERAKLVRGDSEFLVRGVGYAPFPTGWREGDAVPPCVFARDLPLMAAMGANTVRTYTLLPEDDTVFVSLLETTGLYWLAGFPLDSFHDPERTLAERRDEILTAFRAYASRFRGERHLIGYVFGEDVSQDYNSKFAGSVADFYSLLGGAAGVLRELEPDETPLVATSTTDLAQLRDNPPDLSFWLWEAGSRRTLAAVIGDLGASPTPVLVSGYGIDAYDPATGFDNEQAQAQVAWDMTREIESTGFLLGGIYSAFVDDHRAARHLGIFRLAATGQIGVDHVRPRAVHGTLAGMWFGRTLDGWKLGTDPRMKGVLHAASGQEAVAPGTLVRVSGEALERNDYAANGIPWPFHLNQTCLCVGGRPAPLGMVSADSVTAQIPWNLDPGEHPAVVYRAGLATNVVLTQVDRYAPGIFQDGILRAGTSCRVTAENGVRPGELIEVYATGIGPGAPSWVTPSASINGASAEVIYSGTMPGLVGLNQVNLRISPLTPPGPNSVLTLKVGGVSSHPYSLPVVSSTDRYGIAISAPESEVVVQAGGPAKTAMVRAEGRNGYCGPVLLAAAESPAGVTFRAPVGGTGAEIPLEVRASSAASPQTRTPVILYGQAAGATSGAASLKVTVLAGLGDIRVLVISGGFHSLPVARFDWDGRTLFSASGGGPGRGINLLAVDPATGVFSSVRSYDTWGDETASARLVSYLTGLPAGTLVLFAVADDGSLQLTGEARETIAALFGSRAIRTLGYQHSWAMIGRKGASAPIAEGSSSSSQIVLDRTLSFPMPSP